MTSGFNQLVDRHRGQQMHCS